MTPTVKLYALETRPGEWAVYEKHPVPGGKDMLLVVRKTKRIALRAARLHLKENRGGSCFKAERAILS